MAGLTGIVNCERKLNGETENIRKMAEVLKHRGNGAIKIKNCSNGVFGCAPWQNFADEKRCIPLVRRNDNAEYVICFDGLIYNFSELKGELNKKGVDAEEFSDEEAVLEAYIIWGAGCLKKLNGIFAFAIWNAEKAELFLARDRFGIKPLYYTVKNGCFIFASEIKGILAHPAVNAVLDKKGICEVLGLGPAQTQGLGIFKDINEILPAHCATFNRSGFNEYRYWSLESVKENYSFEECLEMAKKLTFDAINSQLCPKGKNLCCFLSGGLDSSAITALAAQNSAESIDTFSLKYVGNDEYFKPTEYQPAADDYYIELMSEQFKTKHHIITVDNETLLNCLGNAVIARDLPGMADVDSSLYHLCREIGKDFSGALSGECADEVFGGYPWFHRKEDFEAKVFPWAKNIEIRKNLIQSETLSPKEIEDYILGSYNRSVLETPPCPSDNAEEKRRREIAHLNLNWFMYTLGARSERIGMNCGLEIRMPYCDYKLVEFLWNVPWEFKAYKEREKGLLRMAFEGVLPEEVLWRKKSPFPKTHNPEYEEMVKAEIIKLSQDKDAPVWELVNFDYIKGLLDKPSDYGKPWFGQLMATPQLYAYVLQVDFWLRHYNVQIKI